MKAVNFPESNTVYKRPPDLEESQCFDIPAFHGIIEGGTLDGARIVVTAWQPTPEEIEQIVKGAPVFLSSIGGLPPHFLTTTFQNAVNVA